MAASTAAGMAASSPAATRRLTLAVRAPPAPLRWTPVARRAPRAGRYGPRLAVSASAGRGGSDAPRAVPPPPPVRAAARRGVAHPAPQPSAAAAPADCLQAAASAGHPPADPKSAHSPALSSQPPPSAYKRVPGAEPQRVTLTQRLGSAAKIAAASVVLAFAAGGMAHAATAANPELAPAPVATATTGAWLRKARRGCMRVT